MTQKTVAVIFLAIFAKLLIDVSCTKTKAEAKRDILNQILPTNPNDILVPPGNGSGGPTLVQLFLHVKSIESLNYKKMELTTTLYIRQTWKDSRLQYDRNKYNVSRIVINNDRVIWTPDNYIPNLLRGHSNDIMSPNTFIQISPDGTVLYSKGVSLTTSCPMDLKRFPFDYQACDVLISTYGSTNEDVLLVWRDNTPATIIMDTRPPEYTVEFFSTYHRTASLSTGKYNILVLTFLFNRELPYYSTRIFIPCSMLVVLSWMSLIVSRKQLTIRLLLGIPALVTCTILVCDQHKTTGKLSYNTSLDVFTGTSLTFILLSIFESITVHILEERADSTAKPSRTENEENKGRKTFQKWFHEISGMADKIDSCARLIIPLSSLLFCFVYFYVGTTRHSSSTSIALTNYTVTSGVHL